MGTGQTPGPKPNVLYHLVPLLVSSFSFCLFLPSAPVVTVQGRTASIIWATLATMSSSASSMVVGAIVYRLLLISPLCSGFGRGLLRFPIRGECWPCTVAHFRRVRAVSAPASTIFVMPCACIPACRWFVRISRDYRIAISSCLPWPICGPPTSCPGITRLGNRLPSMRTRINGIQNTNLLDVLVSTHKLAIVTTHSLWRPLYYWYTGVCFICRACFRVEHILQ